MLTNERRLPCFKAFDIRGRVPDELDEAIAYRTGQAFVELRRPARMAVGHDMRLSSRALADALVEGGIMVTTSHNPADYNGMKIVGNGARPVHGGNGLREREALVADGYLATGSTPRGRVESPCILPDYLDLLCRYVPEGGFPDMTIVTNPGNGGAGLVVDALERLVPAHFVKVHHEADGNFPDGAPNPLLAENRKPTADAVVAHDARMGVAWGGDHDRCFLFDEKGAFIEGYYIVGLLAQEMPRREPGSRIIYEPRLTWNTLDMVREAGGQPVLSRTGHAFIKDRMRAEDAVYGGEINREVADIPRALDVMKLSYARDALTVDETDGLSFEFEDWRFNVRPSNTEPVIRLNVESRADAMLMREKTDELLAVIAQA